MMLTLFSLTILGISSKALSQMPHKFEQHDYRVTLHRIEVIYSNAAYLRNLKIDYVLYNRTTRAINGSGQLLRGLGHHLRTSAQYYKFMSNEYRYFPMTVGLNACQGLQDNTFGIQAAFKKYCYMPTSCPIEPGFYNCKYAVLDFSKFPPLIPGGQYKAVIKLLEGSTCLFEGHVYAKVEPLMKWEMV